MTTKEKETSALLPIIGALWLSGGAAVASTQMINERRDVIMLGFLDGRPLSILHRQTILHDDWLPLVIVMAIGSVVLTTFFVMVPFVLQLNRSYRILCLICAASPGLGLVSWCVQGIAEYNMMLTLLADEAAATR